MRKRTGTKKTIVDFNRNQICSVSLKDIDNIDDLTVVDRKNYLQQAESLYSNPVFQNEIKVIIQKQLEYMGMEAKNMEEVWVSRGTINGIDLLRERIEALHSEYIQAIKPAEKFDRFEVGV